MHPENKVSTESYRWEYEMCRTQYCNGKLFNVLQAMASLPLIAFHIYGVWWCILDRYVSHLMFAI